MRGKGFRQMLTIADKEGKGGKATAEIIADNEGKGGQANADSH